MSEAGNRDFANWARRRMAEMDAEAEEATLELGLPSEAKFAVLSDLYAQPTERLAQAGLPSGWVWLISSLFPLQVEPRLMGRDRSSDVVLEARHEHEEQGVLLSVRKVPTQGGATVDLEVEVRSRDGSPMTDLVVALVRPRQPRLEQITDAAGLAKFRGLLNTRWRDWTIEVAR